MAACLALAGLALGGPVGAVNITQEGPVEPEHRAPQSRPPAVTLPESVGGWSRAGAPRRIDAAGIFEYMDGAGELYLAYRFDHLDVVEYASPTQGEILLELYWMRTSDDAYGLLSGDWGGEPVVLVDSQHVAPPRALYGAGLLRLWSDDLYVRVMAARESDTSRGAVLALGKAIVAGRPESAPPRLASSLPRNVAGMPLRADSVCFLRSHLVLNSVYFVSQRDILNLGTNVDAVIARYGKARLFLAHYPDKPAARAALERFRAAYLPEAASAESGLVHIEDGWTGFQLSGHGLAVVFEAADPEAVASLTAAGVKALENVEARHE
jgi:Family of unknown function (DUF6599)